MASQFPIHFQPLLNLGDQGVSAASFRFGNVTLEGDRNLVVRDVESNELCIFNLSMRNALGLDNSPSFKASRKPTQAESAIMHPTRQIIALRAKSDGRPGQILQVLNLETKARLGTASLEEPIVLWKWVSTKNIAIVAEKSIYHWTINENGTTSDPIKVCDREGRLAEAVQIIDYVVDAEMKWSMLVGISTLDGGKTIDGSMQLCSLELGKQQQLEGHAACFDQLIIDQVKGFQPVICFTEKKRGIPGFKLHIRDIYSSRDGATDSTSASAPLKICVDIQMPPDAPSDFPLNIHISQKFGVIFLVTKGGYVLLFDALTGTQLFRHRVVHDSIFLCANSPQTGGIITVQKQGIVSLLRVNMHTIIPYINQALSHIPTRQQLATSLSKRYGLPGSDEALIQLFNQQFSSGNYKAAARICATLQSGRLRTPQIIQQFKSIGSQPGQTSAILNYFSTLLEYGQLNAIESVELVRPVVAQGRKEFIANWLSEDKLECTEELGDIVKALDATLAVDIYKRAPNCEHKVLQTLAESGKENEVIEFATSSVGSSNVDYVKLLTNLLNTNPEAALQFARKLVLNEPTPLLDPNLVIDMMLERGKLQELTSLMLDYLKGNKPEHAAYQTRILEINLMHSPQVAETIFQMEMLSHYDRARIAGLCEKAGLAQRALENYTDVIDIKRVMLQAGGKISMDWIQQYFSRMPSDTSLEILTDMLRSSSQNLQSVVGVAVKFHEQIGTQKLISMFEKFNSYEGIFYFLGSILSFSVDPEVHFKYIEAAAKLNHNQEVERVCRESKYYEPNRVKEFLKAAKLSDPRPLIYVCDLHGYVSELAEYLYKNSLLKFIEVYISRVNSNNAPIVVATLIDLDAPEDFIKNLLQVVRGTCSAAELVEEVENRNRLRLLLPWLEARVAEGNQDAAVHNALAKIFIDTNRDAESFLKSNAYYDSMEVGNYCAERDPHLAFTAYKRAWGSCDKQLVDLANKNGLYRLQARYLVERQSAELWAYVLQEDNPHRRSVIDQVVSSALPESSSADEVSAAVNAFISAQLPQELIELLEKIVLHNSDFSSNKNLQNLLILTAIKADPSRIVGYIDRLQNFDGAAVAQVAIEYGLKEEAFAIYKKFGLYSEAADTLLSHAIEGEPGDLDQGDFERALEFAQRCNSADVWKKLGKALLKQGRVADAVESFIKANDGEMFREVVDAAKASNTYEPLVDYLLMARKSIAIKDQVLDSELLYTFAKTDRLPDMELFLNGTNTANVQGVGDRLFEEGRFEAAKILYSSLPNYSKLASCYVSLDEFPSAMEAARKAKNPKTWKELAFSALDREQTKVAIAAGLNLIVHPDHLDSLIERFEERGMHKELIEMLEAGIQGERTHVGLFTELGVLYAAYDSEKLMDHCRQHSGRMNIPRLIRACERGALWKEAVYLHIKYDEFEQAANCMMMHPSSWTHEQFTQVMQKVSSNDLVYRSLTFYLEYHPLQVCSLLKALDKKVDHTRVVHQFRKVGHLPLIEKYLLDVQPLNITAVNEALLELYMEEDNVDKLRELVTDYDNFDQLTLAQSLEKYENLEMRRLAALLYAKNKKYLKSVELSKADGQLQDCIQAAKESGNPTLVYDILEYFLTTLKDPGAFAACLYACYSLVKPDEILELAWKNKCMDYCMPYLISVVREVTNRVEYLDRKEKEKQELQKSAPNDYVPDYSMQPSPTLPGMGGLALMPPMPHIQTNSTPFGSSSLGMLGQNPPF